MKPYIVVLTDEAQASPERFLPQIEEALAAQGCRNFQFQPTVGVISVDFPGEVNLGPIAGVLALEEDRGGMALSEHPLAVHDENGNTVGVFGKW